MIDELKEAAEDLALYARVVIVNQNQLKVWMLENLANATNRVNHVIKKSQLEPQREETDGGEMKAPEAPITVGQGVETLGTLHLRP